MTDDHSDKAGEYVIGTLDVDERRAFEARLLLDAVLRQEVAVWRERLRAIADGAPEIKPPARVWRNIEASVTRVSGGSLRSAVSDLDEVRRLRRSRAFWRVSTLGAGALAASILAVAVMIPQAITPPPAETEAGERFVAVVDRGGELPALIVRVDTQAGVVHVRALAAEAPAENSLELWYIAGDEAPRSLGLVADGALPIATPALFENAAGATLAVSVEPQGGSTTGAPTGPVIYSGQLVADE
ncbi:MAG: anti-sigma factor [Microvirga sp.]|nr:anti-sigma factor [Microvirga sp.]